MRKHGLTLVELLGAIVLFGIIASISAMMISTITKSNAKIVEQSRANTEMTLLTAYLDSNIQSFGATTYSACVGELNCIILKKEFEYVPDLINNEIDLVVYTPAEEFRVQVINNSLLVDLETYELAHFTIAPSSTITYTINANQLTYSIVLILSGEYDEYTFNYQKTLTIETIPLG